MLSKIVTTTLLGVLWVPSLCLAAPVMSLGDNSNLIWRMSGAIQYNDNIFLDSVNEKSDSIWVFSPGFELAVGQPTSNANLDFVYVHDFVTYGDNGQLNRDNPDAKLTGSYRTSKSRINYGSSFKENSQNDAGNNLTGDLAHRNTFIIYGNAEWNVTAKSSIFLGADFSKVAYENGRFHDREIISLPINYYWKISPKLDASVGYRDRNTSFSRGADFIAQNPNSSINFRSDYDDQFFNVGLRGEIGPKTSAEIRVGTQQRDFNTPGRKSEDLLSANARVTWQATTKSRGSLLVSRDFNADAFGTSMESTDIQLAGSTQLNDEFSGFASVRLTDDDYNAGRSDDGLFGQIGVTYTPNSHSAISLAYVVYNNQSDFAPADFDNNVINISGTLRY